MASRTATIRNSFGIHCRPSAVIAGEARAYAGKIRVAGEDNRQVNPASVLLLIGLGLVSGTTITITVDGPDAETVADRFVELFETTYDFER